MKKIIKITVYTISVALALWFFLSWCDIVADNTEPNPVHHPYNAFVLMVQDNQEEEVDGMCGDPVAASSDIKCGVIYSIDGNYITFETDDGNLWTAEVGDPNEFDVNRYYCLFFQGEEIVKAFCEVW